jgi:hypothetical protein
MLFDAVTGRPFLSENGLILFANASFQTPKRFRSLGVCVAVPGAAPADGEGLLLFGIERLPTKTRAADRTAPIDWAIEAQVVSFETAAST